MNVKTMIIAFLQKKLFKKEYEKLEADKKEAKRMTDFLYKKVQDYDDFLYKKQSDPKNWIEHITSVYGPFPALEDYNSEFTDFVYNIVKDKNNDYETEADFYADLKPVLDNKALRLLFKYLYSEQIHFIATTATHDESDFSRATLNGFMKIEKALDQVQGQLNEYVREKKAEGMTTEDLYKLL